MKSVLAVALAIGTPISLAACAPPGCYYPTGDFVSYICPAQQQAAEAQAEAMRRETERQAMIDRLGGVRQYQVYENARAWKRWNRTYVVMFQNCVQQAGIPVSDWQDQYIKRGCSSWAMQVLKPSEPPILR